MKSQELILISILIGLACSPMLQAVNPPPDGGYAGGNTAEGQNALLNLTSGAYNTAVGFLSLSSNTRGNFNTGVGAGTLLANTAGNNTATGAGALLSNTTGANNTANGESALFFNTTGTYNTANGVGALENNTIGGTNTATGVQALEHNTTASNNTANGVNALRQNTTAGNNTATGYQALVSNATGADNTALGSEAGRDQTTGSGNVYIGRSMVGAAGESNKTYIRNINITGLNGTAVTVDVNTGLLGHATFCGHDHFYDHMTVQRDKMPLRAEMHQFTVGTAGAPYYSHMEYPDHAPYPKDEDWKLKQAECSDDDYGYILITIDGDTALIEFKGREPDGRYETRDTFSYSVGAL